jgi:aspartyl protease family protein
MFEKVALLAVVSSGVAIGLLWPNLHGANTTPVGGHTVVIDRSSDHHYYVDGSVNGASVRFMVDTGASETALTEADARAIGIKFDPSNYEVLGDGASGLVRGQYVRLEAIDVQGIRQVDAQAVVVPGAQVSLLGQPFLEKVDEIVIHKGEMRLSDAGS